MQNSKLKNSFPFSVFRFQFQELRRVALFALGKFRWCAFEDDPAALSAGLGAEVDNMVGALDNLHIVLHDYHRMTRCNQRIKGLEKAVDVVDV